MGRPLRIEYPGAFYHVTSRGNERKAIFRAIHDYERFVGYFESATDRYGARIHCFCLMPNHYHMLLETPRGNLCSILHHINTSYTNYFNAKTKRVGHLFQGRYRAILVEKDAYALELSRYIHLNPVRARIVEHPSGYPWSSYLGYEGKAKRWSWLQTGFVLGQISMDESKARKEYRRYVEKGMGQPLGDPLEKVLVSTLLGSDEFLGWVKEKWIGKVRPHRDIPALRRFADRPDLSAILRQTERVFGRGSLDSRRVGLYLSHRFSGYSLGEVGEFFGSISPSGVSQNTRRFELQLRDNPELSKEIDRLKKILSQ